MQEFYNDDCMNVMSKYEDKYFDLAIVDPPYFKGPNTRKYYGRSLSTTKIKRKNYTTIDDWEVPKASYFDELFRVSKNQIIWGLIILSIILILAVLYGIKLMENLLLVIVR